MTDAPISCEQLPAAIAAETDATKRAVLQAEFDTRCGGDATDSGPTSPAPTPTPKPKQN